MQMVSFNMTLKGDYISNVIYTVGFLQYEYFKEDYGWI